MPANKFTDSGAPSSEGVSQAGNNNEGTAVEATSVTNLLNLTPDNALITLSAFMSEAGQPAYRARQVHRYLWLKPVASFEEMSDVPKALRDQLAQRFALPRLAIDTDQQSSDGTRKFLFRLADGQAIETVAIPDGKRLTLCISSQAGCALQCAFCATGLMGFARNLEPHEIGYVPQFSIAFDLLTVWESLLAASLLRVYGPRTEQRDEALHHILTEVGLDDIADRRVEVLSGGQKRRLAEARGTMETGSSLTRPSTAASARHRGRG